MDGEAKSPRRGLLGSGPRGIPKAAREASAPTLPWSALAGEAVSAAAHQLSARAIEAFELLVEQSEAGRRAWFLKTGALDPVLASRVAALLQADENASERIPTTPPQVSEVEEPPPPERIGVYKLSGRLGGGGMGDVYLGLRDDGLFEQAVAIKIIKQNLISPTLSARFNEERRILASLHHPNVAQLFDGGVTTQGRSFIVMEYVNGSVITDYVRSGETDVLRIVGLFSDICAAVQCAHDNLVVHADIKPSNVMVTTQGRVKLLDFGIARLLGRGAVTGEGEGGPEPMTRAYASPERRAGVQPTVASDVFALGVLLYELLTGRAPDEAWPTEGLAPGSALPRLRASAGAAKTRTRRFIWSELEAIVAKATTIDPEERYANVGALADDVARLQSGLPLRIRQSHWRYQALCLARRRRYTLAASALAILIAAAAVAEQTDLYSRSEASRLLADQRLVETQRLANYTIAEADEQLAAVPGTLSLRRDLLLRSEASLRRLAADRGASAALKLDVARGYLRLAQIFALGTAGSLGDMPKALSSLSQARQVLGEVAAGSAQQAQDLLLTRADAEVIEATAIVSAPEAGAAQRVTANLTRAEDGFRQVLTADPHNLRARLGLWRADLINSRLRAYLDDRLGSLDLAARHLQDAAAPPPLADPATQREAFFLKTATYLLAAEANMELGRSAPALSYYRRLHQILVERRRQTPLDLQSLLTDTTALKGQAEVLQATAGPDQALPYFVEAIWGLKRLAKDRANSYVGDTLDYVELEGAAAFARVGEASEADTLANEALEDLRAKTALRPKDAHAERLLALGLSGAARINRTLKRPAQGCAIQAQAMRQWSEVKRLGGVLPMDLSEGGSYRLALADMNECERASPAHGAMPKAFS